MKKAIALLLALVLTIPFMALYANAGVGIQRCITWKLRPFPPNATKQEKDECYIAYYLQEGDPIVPPDVVPTYSKDGVEYLFLGWKLATLQDSKNYNNDPSLGFTPATYVQEELLTVMPADEVSYNAIFYKPFRGDLNYDGLVSISDVTVLLNRLAEQEQSTAGIYDIDESGIVSITDVTALLGMLT